MASGKNYIVKDCNVESADIQNAAFCLFVEKKRKTDKRIVESEHCNFDKIMYNGAEENAMKEMRICSGEKRN